MRDEEHFAMMQSLSLWEPDYRIKRVLGVVRPETANPNSKFEIVHNDESGAPWAVVLDDDGVVISAALFGTEDQAEHFAAFARAGASQRELEAFIDQNSGQARFGL